MPLESALMYFDCFVHTVRLIVGPDHGQDEIFHLETLEGLWTGIQSNGYSLLLTPVLIETINLRSGRILFVLDCSLVSNGTEDTTYISATFAVPLSVEDAKRLHDGIQDMKTRHPTHSELGIITEEQHEELLRSIGLSNPPS